MSTNKSAVTRYLALDKCFRNTGRKYNINDLLDACNQALAATHPESNGIKKRQLYDDIKYMESSEGYDVSLDKRREGKEVYYRYTDPKFSIRDRALNETEITHLVSALNVLTRFKGLPQFEWLEEVVAKFESGLGLKKGAESIIAFDENLDYTAANNIRPLFNAIFYKTVLKIKYRNFKTEENYDVIIHPYYLKQYNNRWFCFGLNENGRMITNLALDRILSIKELKKKYIENETVNFEAYFEDVIGVTVQGETEKVKLKVVPSLWPYVETKPLHGTQKIVKKEKDGVVVSIEVKLNYELQSLILSHGEKLTVLEPEKLRKEILTRVQMIQ